MTDYLLLAALIVVAVFEFLGGRLMHRLNLRCQRAQRSEAPDPGLLRWYAQGFERPLGVARWLVRISALLLAVELILRSDPALMAATAVLLLVGVLELRRGAALARRHLQAVHIQHERRP